MVSDATAASRARASPGGGDALSRPSADAHVVSAVRDSAVVARARDTFDPDGVHRIGLVVRIGQRYIADGMLERAPAIAYYGILSLFPALLLGSAAVKLVAGDSAPDDIASYSRELGSSRAVADALRSAAETAQDASAPTAGAAGIAGLMTLVYGASRAFTALGRAVDAIGRQTRQPRSLLRRLQDIGWTLVLLVMCIVMLVLVSVSGAVLEDVLERIGIGDSMVVVWTILRWPIAATLALLVIAILRSATPTGKRPPFRLVSAGRIVTVVALVVATAGFNVWVMYLASYNALYGAFSTAIVLMLWIWMCASSVLLGAVVDAVLREPREPQAPLTRSGR